MRRVVIVSGARTPIGRFGGSFKSFGAPELGAVVIKAAMERAGIRATDVEEVIMGTSIQAADSGFAARLSALKAGIPQETPTMAVNRQCASGLEAINMAAQLILTGDVDIVIAGGTENMSMAPYLLPKARWEGLRIGDGVIQDCLIEALQCPVNRYHMGVTAENIASRFEIGREEQDKLALLSHQRAVRAIQEGRFKEQIVAVSVPQPKGDPLMVLKDEHPRADSSLEKLGALPTAFKEGGSVTAGNSSGINDGAAAVVMMSEEKARALGLKPKLAWVARAAAGVDPAIMGTGPVPAVRKLLKKTGMDIKDIDLVELNEAFAVQALYCIRELNLDIEKTNVNGSGISLGHPVGATGAIMTVRLMEELARQGQEMGIVTMCVAAGQGSAAIFQRLN